MRRTHWAKKIFYGITWVLIVFFGCNIILRGLELPKDSFLRKNLEQFMDRAGRNVTEAMVKVYSPAGEYFFQEDRDTLAKQLTRYAFQMAPVQEYMMAQTNAYETQQDPYYEWNEELEPEVSTVVQEEGEEPGQDTEGETGALTEGEEGAGTEAIMADGDVFHPKVVGTEYSLAKLSDYDFLIRNFYAVSEITTINSSELNAQTLLSRDMALQGGNEAPQILIYHSHSQEEFVDSVPGEQEDTIVGVGSYLTELLTSRYGYSVIHDKTTYDVQNGVTDRNRAYDYAAEGITRILEENPSIEVVIDLHRDGVNEGVRLVTEVNGKSTAQIMFVNGISKTTMQGNIDYLYNPYIEDNMALSLQLQLKAKAYYPEFTRRIMIKAYRYNLHFRPKSLLIEVGAQTCTLQEAKNAMEPLAVMLNEILK